MNAEKRLAAARNAIVEGRHAEALAELIWFHSHALEESRSWYGVRLSFALSYWKELGDVYPPALEALKDVRDRTFVQVKSNLGGRHQFHDVACINEYLNEFESTRSLFEVLDAENTDLASACAHLALDSLVRTEAYALASKYLRDPITDIHNEANRVNLLVSEIQDRPRSKSPSYGAYTHNFAAKLNLVMRALSGANRLPEAEACKEAAFAVLKRPYVRRAVEKALARKA